MKRVAVIIAVIFAVGILMSSCNKQACPAYSHADTEQSEPSA